MENFKVYESISAVQKALAEAGISKDRTNTQGFTFKYRGIDDTYNTLAPILSENKLCILPRMLSKEVVERESAKGGVLIYTTVSAEYDFVSAVDGSKHTVGPIYGEAMDSGDKSIGKAMSYAYKSMAFMTFSIPTDGENDPDAQTHEVAPVKQPKAVQQATQHVAAPSGDWQSFMLTFGKHKGKTLGEADPSYLSWLSGTEIKNPALASALAGWSAAQNPSQELPTIKVEEREREEWKPPVIDDEADAMYGADGKHRGGYSIEE